MLDRRADDDLDALPGQPVPENGACLCIGNRQETIGRFDKADLRAQPAERLGELGANRPGAQHQHPARDRREGKDILVGQKRRPGEPGNRRDHGFRAGTNDKVSTGDAPVAYRDRVFVDEVGHPERHLYALLRQGVGRLESVHTIDGGAHSLHDPAGIGGGG